MNITAHDTIGPDAVTFDQGQQLYSMIYPQLQEGQSVTVDFNGVEVFTSSFLNAAFGQLYRDMSSDFLRQHITIENAPAYTMKLLGRVNKNARRFYHDSAYQSAVTTVLTEYAKEG